MQTIAPYFQFVSIFVFIIIVSFFLELTLVAWAQDTGSAIGLQSIVSTRNHFDRETGALVSTHNSTNYDAINIPWLKQGAKCPVNFAIIVPGWGNDANKSMERFERAKMSLEHNNYHDPIIGFSWDSDTTIQSIGAGWTVANLIAKDNGPKLAQFIADFKDKCNNSEIRILAHSLGSRVILSSLDSLNNNQYWKDRNFTLASVHLLGAAVDNEEVADDPLYIINNVSIVNNTLEWYDVYGIKFAYGQDIEDQVSKFYNLFNPNDKTLSDVYGNYEYDDALGLNGAQVDTTLSSKYVEKDVQNKIPPLCDAEGDDVADWPLKKNETVERGSNHGGYFGFTNMMGNKKVLLDDGAMNTVVRDWNNTLVREKQNSTLSAICNTPY
jgi:Alpha/beta hydrolase of unknown function (DUF900)